MAADSLDPMESFETWLLRRVAQAVEAGEVSAILLAELKADFDASRGKPPEESHADAAQDIAVQLTMPVEEVEAGLAALEAQPRVIREVLMRRIAEAWLEGALGSVGAYADYTPDKVHHAEAE
ncbi:MAG: hypothetical protein ABSD47_20935 [Candidatus Methylomirabilota bacterium]|jgi:hypothetical protein